MIGIQPSAQQLNQQAGQIALQARNAIHAIINFNTYLTDQGLTGLTTNIGMTSADAQNLLTIFADMNSAAMAMTGQPYAGPALPHDFVTESAPLWGGN